MWRESRGVPGRGFRNEAGVKAGGNFQCRCAGGTDVTTKERVNLEDSARNTKKNRSYVIVESEMDELAPVVPVPVVLKDAT